MACILSKIKRKDKRSPALHDGIRPREDGKSRSFSLHRGGGKLALRPTPAASPASRRKTIPENVRRLIIFGQRGFGIRYSPKTVNSG